MKWTLLGLAVGISVVTWMVSTAAWLRHEAQKARRNSEQRKTLDRIVQASMPPAAPGINRKRVS